MAGALSLPAKQVDTHAELVTHDSSADGTGDLFPLLLLPAVRGLEPGRQVLPKRLVLGHPLAHGLVEQVSGGTLIEDVEAGAGAGLSRVDLDDGV